MKFWLIVSDRKTVPRTNILADVAAKHPILHFIPKTFRNFIFQFNGRIRDTFAAVNNLIANNGIGWARINTAGAGSAMISRRRIRNKLQITDNFG